MQRYMNALLNSSHDTYNIVCLKTGDDLIKQYELPVKTGAAYIRVSTEEQTELSPDAQKRLILDYAEKNRILIPKEHVFIENGISGKYAKRRPEFQRMIALAKSEGHPFDLILVWKFSRFARNQEESIVYKSMLKKDKIEVISVSEPLADGPFGSLIERIIEWMDEYYSIRLSGEVVRGMTEKAMRGGYQAAPPLGYQSRGGGKAPAVVEKEAAVIRMIFNLYLHDIELSGIAKKLNDMGCRTKKGGCFESRSVRYILTNPFYMGKVRWNPDRKEQTAASDSKVIVADGTHLPLICEQDFHRVQELLMRQSAAPSPRLPSGCSHWLSGLLKCPVCGSGLSYNHAQYGSFQCWQYAKGRHPVSSSVSARKASAAALLSLSQMSAFQAPLFYPIKKLADSTQKKELLQKELKRIEEKEKRTQAAYENGVDSLAEYSVHKKRLESQRRNLITELDSLTLNSLDRESENLPSKICSVSNLLESPDTEAAIKNKALHAVLKKAVYQKESDEFHFYYYL